MPEYSYEHRTVISDMSDLWAVQRILERPGDHAWTKRIIDIRDMAVELAREMRDFVEQYETEED